MKRRSTAPHQRERGAALILVVWAVGLMAVFAASAARDARLDNEDARLTRGTVIAKALAEAGLRQGTLLWRAGDEEALAGTILCRAETGLLRLDLAPANARIDLNLAQEDLLASLFRTLGADDAIAVSAAALIADYRDSDSTPRPHGGEFQAYERAGLAHGPRNDAIQLVAELAHIPGIPAWLYQDASTHLTVSGSTAVPDLDLASPVVRTAVEATLGIVPAARAAPVRSGRIDSRSMNRTSAQSSGSSAASTAKIRIRAAAQATGGGFHVLDAEISGGGRSGAAPAILRLDTGSIMPEDFLPESGEDIPVCALPAE